MEGSTRKLVVLPQSLDSARCFVSLQHPRTGTRTDYLIAADKCDKECATAVCEVMVARAASPTSWFVGDRVCSVGEVFVATPIDPLFLLLPLLEASRHKFQPLSQILHVHDVPDFRKLAGCLATADLSNICEVQGASAVFFLRSPNPLTPFELLVLLHVPRRSIWSRASVGQAV